MNIAFSNTIWYWKGSASFCFVTVPAEQSHDLKTCLDNLGHYTASAWPAAMPRWKEGVFFVWASAQTKKTPFRIAEPPQAARRVTVCRNQEVIFKQSLSLPVGEEVEDTAVV